MSPCTYCCTKEQEDGGVLRTLPPRNVPSRTVCPEVSLLSVIVTLNQVHYLHTVLLSGVWADERQVQAILLAIQCLSMRFPSHGLLSVL